jgi:hypothetical protein
MVNAPYDFTEVVEVFKLGNVLIEAAWAEECVFVTKVAAQWRSAGSFGPVSVFLLHGLKSDLWRWFWEFLEALLEEAIGL